MSFTNRRIIQRFKEWFHGFAFIKDYEIKEVEIHQWFVIRKQVEKHHDLTEYYREDE